MIGSIFDPKPARLELLPSSKGHAGIDVDKNGKIDDSDAYLTLETNQGAGYVDFKDIQKALQGFKPGQEVTEQELVGALTRDYQDDNLKIDGTSVTQGPFCFDMLSSYRQKQTFQVDGDKIFYNLTPDPDAPYEQVGEGRKVMDNGTVSLVEDADGMVHWDYGTPPPAPAVDPQAVTEAVCVRRDGMLHWVFPGERLEPGDSVVGNTDNFAANLLKG